MSEFLKYANIKIKRERPSVPNYLKYTIYKEYEGAEFVQIWFRTKGCKNNIKGGCTVCDYWTGEQVNNDEIVSSFQEALSQIDFNPSTILINSSGSVFDEWEVTKDVRNKILETLKKFVNSDLIFETHIETINEDLLKEIRAIISNQKIYIEFGLESASGDILEYCLNKSIDLNEVKYKCLLLNDYGIETIANVLVGVPFLSLNEMLNDSLRTLKWAFEMCGVKKCVVFPINIKEWTLLNMMERKGIYNQPSLWLLVEVLSRVEETLLNKIELSWFKYRQQYHPLYKEADKPPYTCDKCYSELILLLEEYARGSDRIETVKKLNSFECECRNEFYNFLEKSKNSSEWTDRINRKYEDIALELFGEDWWGQNKDKMILGKAVGRE